MQLMNCQTLATAIARMFGAAVCLSLCLFNCFAMLIQGAVVVICYVSECKTNNNKTSVCKQNCLGDCTTVVAREIHDIPEIRCSPFCAWFIATVCILMLTPVAVQSESCVL